MAEMVTGKTIRMPCMRRGLVSYPDETILVTQTALERMKESAYGIPMVIEHPGVPITSESLKDIAVIGRVAAFDYDMTKDLWFADFVVDDDEAVKLLKEGWGVSTAWYGHEYTAGGTYNNVPYDRELLSARYEHLAIVKTPRYEMAVDPVFLNSKSDTPCKPLTKTGTIVINSKSNSIGGHQMFAKIWRTVREEVKANENEELVLELEHGQVPLSKIVEELSAYRAKEASKKEEEEKEKEPAKRVLNDDDEVEVDGKKMKVHELVAEYNKAKEAGVDKGEEKHEAAADEKKGEDEAKKQESEAMCDEDDEKKLEKKAENARFNSLKSAYENGSAINVEDQFVSTRERVDMGKARYGKK